LLFVYGRAKAAAVYRGFKPVFHHLERFTPGATLRQGIEHRYLGQPPTTISHQSSGESHIQSLHALLSPQNGDSP
jgi:hypothetical protein